MRSGQPLPERIANAPELQTGLELYLQAFFELDSERSDLARIPWSSIADYAIAYDFDEDQAADLIDIIRKVDSAHIKKLADKQAAENQRVANANKSIRTRRKTRG